MSSRNKLQSSSVPHAALIALTASAPAAGIWWWLTGSIKNAIETYDAEQRSNAAALSEHRRVDEPALMNTSSPDHTAATRRSFELQMEVGASFLKFMAALRRLAHMPPPAPEPKWDRIRDEHARQERERTSTRV